MAADTTKKHFIRIRGANVNNLKNLSVDIPRDKFVVFTGLSGSGKSSLAFDTIYAEGQRRYMESLFRTSDNEGFPLWHTEVGNNHRFLSLFLLWNGDCGW